VVEYNPVSNTVCECVPLPLQVRVRATNTLCRSQTAEALVNINVLCNEDGPGFTQNLYTATINETLVIGSCFLTVQANDPTGVGWLFTSRYFFPAYI